MVLRLALGIILVTYSGSCAIRDNNFEKPDLMWLLLAVHGNIQNHHHHARATMKACDRFVFNVT
jgi:hypothetical protein